VMSCLAVWPVAALFGLGFGRAPRRNGILVNPPLSLSHVVHLSTKMPGRPGFPATRPAPENETARTTGVHADWRRLLFRPQLWEKQARGPLLAARAFLISNEVTKGSSCHGGNASSLSFSVPGASKPFRRRKKSTTIVILSLSNHSKV
jgi:hypothetical protein